MRHRHVLLRIQVAAFLLAASVSSAAAQASQPRVTLSAIAGREEVRLQSETASFDFGGASIRVRVLQSLSLHGEVTRATGELRHSSEGVFRPGTGFGFGLAFHTPPTQRAGVSVSLGFAEREIAREYTLFMPGGVPVVGGRPHSASHGGPFLSLAVPINVTNRLVVSPEIRWHNLVGDHDDTSRALSVQVGWRF